jgi:hypothetical protein
MEVRSGRRVCGQREQQKHSCLGVFALTGVQCRDRFKAVEHDIHLALKRGEGRRAVCGVRLAPATEARSKAYDMISSYHSIKISKPNRHVPRKIQRCDTLMKTPKVDSAVSESDIVLRMFLISSHRQAERWGIHQHFLLSFIFNRRSSLCSSRVCTMGWIGRTPMQVLGS